jgi:aspartate 1-decarboxylase
LVIICAFAGMTAQEAASFQPTVVLLGENNQIKIK